MERRENQLQTAGICRRVFTFVMNTIALRGIKRVTLGHPQLRDSSQEPLVVPSPHKDASHAEKNSIDSEPVMVQIPRDYDGMNLSLIHIDSGLSSDAAKSSKPVQVRSKSPRTVPIEGNGMNNRLKDSNVHEKDNISSKASKKNGAVKMQEPVSKKNDAVKMQEPASKKNDAAKVVTPAGPKKNNDAAVAKVLEPAPKNPASVRFGAIEERDLTAKRKQKTMPREQLTLAIDIEPAENDVNTSINGPRTYRPMFRSAASNVNEKAEAFIRRRREALSKSMTNNEPRGYD